MDQGQTPAGRAEEFAFPVGSLTSHMRGLPPPTPLSSDAAPCQTLTGRSGESAIPGRDLERPLERAGAPDLSA
eukprot:6749467-Alexandrium_andersonii.AAC.1